MYLSFWDIAFVCVENAVCADGICRVYICRRLNVREISLSVCSELDQVCFSIGNECMYNFVVW